MACKLKFNPDAEVVFNVRQKLTETNGQCPCVIPELWNVDTRCPCKKAREESECHCGLYVKVEVDK